MLSTASTHKAACRPNLCNKAFPAPNARSNLQLRGHSCVRASALANVNESGPKERVLRYPDGYERRIVYPESAFYPEPAQDEDYYGDGSLTIVGIDSDVDVNSLFYWDETECSLVGAACLPLPAEKIVASSKVAVQDAEVQSAITSWEQELSALLNAHQAEDVGAKVSASYQVLTGCPWLLSRPLFVLSQQQQITGQSTLYSLQTRMAADAVQDELAKVLKVPGLAQRLSYSKLRDGVVAFATAEDAARFATCLEADIDGEVEVMEVDSHSLFLTVGDVDGVVVHLPSADFLPLPNQLGTSLRAGPTGEMM